MRMVARSFRSRGTLAMGPRDLHHVAPPDEAIHPLQGAHRRVAGAAAPVPVTFGFGFSAIFKQAGAGNYIDFLAPGIVCMAIVFSSVFSGIEVMWDRQFGFLKETLVAPVSRTALMFGRTLGGATVALIQGLLVLIVTLIVGFRPSNWALVPRLS